MVAITRYYGPGLVLGLYVARLLAEVLRGAWGVAGPPALAILGAAGGLALGGWTAKRRLDLISAWVLLLYVLWPRLDPTVALGVGFIAAIAMVASSQWPVGARRAVPVRLATDYWPLIAGVMAFFIYVSTLAPDVLPADSGEFQLAAPLLGVPHPPGYPLYMLLGKLFTLIPIGNLAYRLNLLSAVTGALTLALVGATVHHIILTAGFETRPTAAVWGGLAAALALGAATTFWAQSTTANIRSLTGLFTALCLYALVTRRLKLFALSLGFGLTHHASLAFFGLFFVLYLLLVERDLWRQPRHWLQLIGLALLPAVVLLYLPVRGTQGAPLAPPDLATWRGFWAHVLARGFAGDMFAFARPDLLAGRLPLLGDILTFEFNSGLLLAMALGTALLLWRDRRLFLLLIGGTALHSFVAITYRAPQTVEYMLPAYVALAVLVGVAAGWLMQRGVALRALGAAILLAGLMLGGRNWPSYRWLTVRDTRDYTQTLLEQSPPAAIILSNWHWATPLWYLQQIEGQRRDVEVRYVFPEGAEPIAQTWARHLDEAVATGRPVIVTQFYAAEFGAKPYHFEPLGEAFLVRQEPRFDVPADLTRLNLDFEDKIRLLGYRLGSGNLAEGRVVAKAGGQIALMLAWQPLVPLDRDYSFFVHLVGPPGPPLAQSDRTEPSTRYRPGEVVLERYVISLPRALASSDGRLAAGFQSGSYRLVTGVYTSRPGGGTQRLTLADGRDTIELASVSMEPSPWPPVTQHPMVVPFGNGSTLIGVDYDTGRPGAPRTYLHWIDRASGGVYTTLADDTGVFLRDGLSLSEPWVGPWGIPSNEAFRLPPPLPGERYVPLGSDLVLTGFSNRSGDMVRPGGIVDIVAQFRAAQPLLRDRVVSVSLIGPGGVWRAQDDSVPALGAIPTLKWVWDSAVTDPHRLHIPADATPGPATGQLIVYDAFTQAPLALLDPRLAQLSPAVVLGTWEVGR